MLSVTLVAVGEVREEFRVGVYALSHYTPTAKGILQLYTGPYYGCLLPCSINWLVNI